MSLFFQGVLLFLFIPLVLILYLRMPLGVSASILAGIAIMLAHRLVARPWMERHLAERCFWCGRAGAPVEAPFWSRGAAIAARTCSEDHRDNLHAFAHVVATAKPFLALLILAPVVLYLANALAAIAGRTVVPHEAAAWSFKIPIALAVVSLSFAWPLGRFLSRVPAIDFPVHNLFLLGVNTTFWVFRIVGLFWLGQGAWALLRTTVLASVVALAFAGRPALAGAPEPVPAMTDAANAFLASLDAAKRAKAVVPFHSDERLNWHYIPRARQGVSFKQMSGDERKAALALLRSSLSAMGFEKAEAIRALERILFAQSGSPVRDAELYFFTVFGAPSAKGAWGWRYEGHHLSLNWTVLDGRLAASTPQFFGANPAEVREGGLKGTRALSAEEDLGRALVKSLRPDQRTLAVVGKDAPDEILTEASRVAALQKREGIPYGKLDAEQQGLLLSLIRAHADAQTPAEAEARLARVRADLPNLEFAWMGGLEKGQGHYYRIQGSTDLIEYDNTQNGANHIHTVWRVFKGDWGRDLLDEHYKASPHHAPSGLKPPTSRP